MDIIKTKYTSTVIGYQQIDIREVWLFDKILLKREYVNPLKKYLQKRDWKYL